MKTVVPSYYALFNCISDRCKHSCCIGWGIFVDDETLEMYKKSDDLLSREICSKISVCEDGAEFITDENKKCPFLDGDGLCRIIKQKGDDWLCQICREHPRFTNCYSDREETGLGLCCEEVCRIIVSSDDNTLITLEDDLNNEKPDIIEEEFFETREKLFGILHNESIDFDEVLIEISKNFPGVGIYGTPKKWRAFLDGLECMDNRWRVQMLPLLSCDSNSFSFADAEEKKVRNLLEYFLYRHLPLYFEGYSIEICISFCLLSVALICQMSKSQEAFNGEWLQEVARMYSCEIEYSDENIYAIINALSKYF